jgi:hypothetical protein
MAIYDYGKDGECAAKMHCGLKSFSKAGWCITGMYLGIMKGYNAKL